MTLRPHDHRGPPRSGPGGGGGAERSDAAPPQPGPERGKRPPDRLRRSWTREFKAALVEAWLASGEPAQRFAAKHGIQGIQLVRWRDAASRPSAPRKSRPRPARRPRRPAAVRPVFSPEEKRAAVEGLQKTELTHSVFAKLFGITARTLQTWVARYKAGGPKALEPKRRGRPKGSGRKPTPPAVAEAIVTTKRRFPWFGLRKIRDLLRREEGLGVSKATIQRVVAEELPGLELPAVPKKRTKKAIVRRFERARPNELWQSDITSFVLARHRQPVYLTVFLDDHSRFIVSWCLMLHQKADLVIEALRSGIAKYGKPREVLTDQGRQYYAWRGKAAFQRILQQDGIQHVVSRAHHPETLGKCERLWETVDREFWQRRSPEDLDDARERLGHFFAHYNFQRPHQGISGLVPADRFFEASAASREAIEAQVAKNALLLSLGETPRKPVFLYGQIGSKRVALHGERGRIVVETGDGDPESLGLDELGGGGQGERVARTIGSTASEPKETSDGVEHGSEQRDEDGSEAAEHDPEHGIERRSGGAAAVPGVDHESRRRSEAGPSGQEAPALHEAAATGLPGAGAVGCGERGGEAGVAPPVRGDSGVVARQGDADGGGGEALAARASALAAEPAGPGGDAGGAASPTAGAGEGDAVAV